MAPTKCREDVTPILQVPRKLLLTHCTVRRETNYFATIFLAGCGASDYLRGHFSGYIIGKTEEQIIAQVGKPTSVDNSNLAAPVWTCAKNTFDVDNNKGDDKVLVFMKKGADGKLMGQDTAFQ